MKSQFIFIFLIIICLFNWVYAQELKTLSLQDCIDIAIKKNPDILASKASVEKNFFKIGEARSGYFPEIDLTLGYQRMYQENSIRPEYSKQYSVQLSLTQSIFDFGKTSKQIQLQQELYKSTEWQDKETVLQTIYNVKEAYFSVLKAKKHKETALEVLNQSKRHLELAKGFYEVGLKPKIEVTKAEVELSNAKLGLITAERQLSQAFLNLKVAMGVIHMSDFDIKEEYNIRKLDEQEILNIAIERNPQLQAIKFNKQASISTEELLKREYMPKIMGTASYGYVNEQFPLDRKWTLFLQMSLPLFSGWSTTYKIKQAKADTAYYSYKEDSIKQQITSQIKNLFVQLKEASQKIETLKIALKSARENLDLAMGRYEVGIGSSIEVVDALVLYEQTNTQYWQAVYDYNVTYAQIQKTAGWLE
ncbi:MAG: TolC family protein [Thermodesulfovibrio sp.]|nr:TolC family protein [Thermodesulfovibrio sp.]MDW7998489.1 TolC family protein [Thermodesulfovibrio sp.]